MFASAKTRGLRLGANPAQWRNHLENELPRRKKLSRGHHAAMPFIDVPSFITSLLGQGGVAAQALKFAILTATRTSEVLNATWNEIDLSAGIWTIPATRMKAGKEHRVPLAARTIEVLYSAKGHNRDQPCFLFPGAKEGKALSNMAMAELLKRMEIGATVHGFRSAFRDWVAETTNFPHEVAEMALAHTIGNKAEAAYRRGDLLDKRRDLMEAWANYCTEASG